MKMLRFQNSSERPKSYTFLQFLIVLQLSLMTVMCAGNAERLHHPFERGKTSAGDIHSKVKRQYQMDIRSRSQQHDSRDIHSRSKRQADDHPFDAYEADDPGGIRWPHDAPEADYYYYDSSSSESRDGEDALSSVIETSHDHDTRMASPTNTSQVNGTVNNEVMGDASAFTTNSVIDTMPNTAEQFIDLETTASVKVPSVPPDISTTKSPSTTNAQTSTSEIMETNSGISYSYDVPLNNASPFAFNNPSSNIPPTYPTSDSQYNSDIDDTTTSNGDLVTTEVSADTMHILSLEPERDDGDNPITTENVPSEAMGTTYSDINDSDITTDGIIEDTFENEGSSMTDFVTDTYSYTSPSEEECSRCAEVKKLKQDVKDLRRKYNSILDMYSQLNESLTQSQDDMANHVASDSEKINNLTTQVDDIQSDIASSLSKLENSLLDRIGNLTRAMSQEQDISMETPAPTPSLDLSRCRYSSDSNDSPSSNSKTYTKWCPSLANSRQGWPVSSVQCSTYGGTQSLVDKRLDQQTGNWRYRCVCRGVFMGAETRICQVHVWECPPTPETEE